MQSCAAPVDCMHLVNASAGNEHNVESACYKPSARYMPKQNMDVDAAMIPHRWPPMGAGVAMRWEPMYAPPPMPNRRPVTLQPRQSCLILLLSWSLMAVENRGRALDDAAGVLVGGEHVLRKGAAFTCRSSSDQHRQLHPWQPSPSVL